MNNATKIKSVLALTAHLQSGQALSETEATLTASTAAALGDVALAWYYSHLDRRCPLTWAQLQRLPRSDPN